MSEKNTASKRKEILYILMFPLLIIYFETVLKASVYKEVINEGYFFMCLFSMPFGILIALFVSGFKERTNRILFVCILSFFTLYYGGQILYYKIFSTFFSLYFIIGAKKVAQFSFILYDVVMENIIPLFFISAPIISVFIYRKKIKLLKFPKDTIYKMAFSMVVLQALTVIAVVNTDKSMVGPKYLYKEVFLIKDSVEKFGLLTTARLDIKNIIKNTEGDYNRSSAKERQNTNLPDANMQTSISEENITYGNNVLNIPFDELIENEKNSKIKDMHEYFKNIKPTKKNEFTGMFQGKNLIMITAEGFSPYAVNKDITPTLYKMQNEGFEFTNFYTPIWGVSTSDGEYVACTSLLPKEGVWSFYKSSENYLPYVLGNQLKNIGYAAYAYHDHYFDYYFRDKSHPNMGYIYKGLGNGLDVTETWPESDIEMIDLSVPEFIDNQPFHTYYMTVSGHLQYNFAGNFIAFKNKDLVKDLNYSEHVKAYLACNIELDRAVKKLIDYLEEANIAEDTLIAISPDHYPYGLTKQEIGELAGHEILSDFELYKGVFLLWSKGMEHTVIHKSCSSLDILPTLSNLMGLDYDSRLLMGKDIFSDSEPLVVFADRSFTTGNIAFEAKTGKITSENTYTEEYINELLNIVKEKFKYSNLILETDYYGIISAK